MSYRWSVLPLPEPAEGVDRAQYSLTPYQRYGHTAVAHDECAYIWGGRNDKDGACDILYCFDTGEDMYLQLGLKAVNLNYKFFHFILLQKTSVCLSIQSIISGSS